MSTGCSSDWSMLFVIQDSELLPFHCLIVVSNLTNAVRRHDNTRDEDALDATSSGVLFLFILFHSRRIFQTIEYAA